MTVIQRMLTQNGQLQPIPLDGRERARRESTGRVLIWAAVGACLVGVAYYAAAQLGLSLLTDIGGVAVFWPASGIAAGILLSFNRAARLPVAIGVLAATVAANLLGDRTLVLAFGRGICNAGEALLLGWLIDRWCGLPFRFDEVDRIAKFAAATVLVAALAAVGGTAAMQAAYTTAAAFDIWRTLFLSDVVGIVTVAPFIVGLADLVRDRTKASGFLEASALLSLLALVTAHVFSASGDGWVVLMPSAALVPILLVLAARHAPAFSAIGAFIVASAMVCAVTFGIGWLGNPDIALWERVVAAQIGAVMVMLCSLVLAALFSERRRNELALRHSNDRLRESNDHLQLAMSGAEVGTFSLEPLSGHLECDARAAHLHGFQRSPPASWQEWRHAIDPRDREAVEAVLGNAHGRPDRWSARYRVLHGSGSSKTRWIALEGSTRRGGDGHPTRLIGVVRDATLEKATEAKLWDQIEAERQVLAKISASVPLAEVLSELVCAVEARSDPGMIASILFLDEQGSRLRHGAAPNLPIAYSQAIDGSEVGPNVGSCGTAAFLATPVLVADISKDPRWNDYREVALAHGLRACSSVPIKGSDGRVIGTFALYYRDVRLPSQKDLEALELVAHVAALAIERHASDQVARLTRERLQLALASAHLGLWSVDLKTGQFENDARDRKQHGHSETSPPRTFEEAKSFVHLDDLPRVEAAFAAARAQGQCTVEYRLRQPRQQAQPIWLAVEATVLRDATGDPSYLLGVTRDVTRQKDVEVGLRSQHQALEKLLGALPVAIYTANVMGQITYCNQSAINLWGRRPQFARETFLEMAAFYHPDGTVMDPSDLPSAIALKNGQTIRGREAILERRDGTRVPIMPCPTPLYDDAGELLGIVEVMVDLTDQKRAEAQLSERSAQLRIAEKAALVGIFAHRVGTPTVQLSPGFAAILGLPDGTTEAPISSWRSRIHPDDLKRLDIARERAFRARRLEHSAEYRMLLPDGETRWIEARNATSYDSVGMPSRMVGVNIDITSRKLAERQKSVLIAELDHRVKNTLARVAAIAQQTRDHVASIDQFLAVFDGRINSMSNTHTLLSRNRWRGVNLGELVRSELAPYSGADNTLVSGPDIILAPDAVQPVAMVIHELVTNAAKYGALSNNTGKVTVCWTWHDYRWKPCELVIQWTETGGPRIVPPKRSSYGTMVIQDLIPYELGGQVDWVFRSTGLLCTLQIPGNWISRASLNAAGPLLSHGPLPEHGLSGFGGRH